VAHLSSPAADKPAGPVAASQNSYVRFSFKEGGEKDVSCEWRMLSGCYRSSIGSWM